VVRLHYATEFRYELGFEGQPSRVASRTSRREAMLFGRCTQQGAGSKCVVQARSLPLRFRGRVRPEARPNEGNRVLGSITPRSYVTDVKKDVARSQSARDSIEVQYQMRTSPIPINFGDSIRNGETVTKTNSTLASTSTEEFPVLVPCCARPPETPTTKRGTR